MLWITILFTLLFAVLGLGLALLVRSLTRVKTVQPLPQDWLEELSGDRYRPMLRLLGDDDLQFLRSQPGFNRHLASRLRRQRRAIFRGYLAGLKSDFRRVTTALRALILQSRYDRPDLASALVRAEARFAMGLAVVRVRLALYQFGLCGVDASDLLRLFAAMQLELRLLVPAENEFGA